MLGTTKGKKKKNFLTKQTSLFIIMGRNIDGKFGDTTQNKIQAKNSEHT